MDDDFVIQQLFAESNFDAHASGSDRYGMVLRAGLRKHGLAADDVQALAQDLKLWAICGTGVLTGRLRGMFTKQAEISEFIPYSNIAHIDLELSGPHTQRIVFRDTAKRKLGQIDIGAGGQGNSFELAASHLNRIHNITRAAHAAATQR